jgi:hypothetical protein
MEFVCREETRGKNAGAKASASDDDSGEDIFGDDR